MTIKNNLYNIFGGAGRALIFLFTIPLMVNYMGVERFGIWALITSVGNIALMLDVGIASTTMHFVSEIEAIENNQQKIINKRQTVPVLFFINIFFSLCIVLLFLFFTKEIASVFLPQNLISKDVILAIRWVGLYSSIMLLQHLFSGIIQAYNNFLTVNIIKFFNILIINLGLLVLSFLKMEFTVLTFFMFCVSLFTLITYIIIASKKLNIFKIKPSFNIIKTKGIINYSLNTWIGYLGNVTFTQFDKIIIGRVCSPEVLGLYAAIISITSYISSIATVGLQPIIPKLTEYWTKIKTHQNEFLNEYKHSIQFNTLLIFSVSLLVFFTYRILLKSVMDINLDIYPEADLAFILAIIIYAINSLSVPGYYTLMAIKQTKHIAIWQITGSITALLMIYFLGLEYGLYGVVIGNIGLIIGVKFNLITSNLIFKSSFRWLNFIYKEVLLFLTVSILIVFIEDLFIRGLIIIISLFLLVNWYLNSNQNSKLLLLRLINKKKV